MTSHNNGNEKIIITAVVSILFIALLIVNLRGSRLEHSSISHLVYKCKNEQIYHIPRKKLTDMTTSQYRDLQYVSNPDNKCIERLK